MEIINGDDEYESRGKALRETENESQRTWSDDNCDYDDSSSTSSSYFLYGETETKSKKLVELVEQKINNVSTIEAAPQEGQVRRCSYCGQEFRSGKALGGHIRIHKKPMKPSDTKPSSSVARDFSTVTDDQNQKRNVCFICKESFPSIMALCGHMRYHPERDWKGIRPPKETTESPPEPEPKPETQPEHHELEPEAPVLNLLEFISNWSMTGKRGRKATISAEKLRMINQVLIKKRKIFHQDAEAENQACKLPRMELKTTEMNKSSVTVELEEGEILEDLPEEGDIIEEDNTNSSDTMSDELELSKKMEACNPGLIMTETKKTARRHYGEKISNHKSFVPMAEEEIDHLEVATAGKNSSFDHDHDHKASLSLRKMFNFDLNLPYEEGI